jgi:hypothetical protein
VLTPAAEKQSRGVEQAPEEEEEGRRPRDLVGICKNLRDSSINCIFSLIQSSNEEMVKIEVI